jgi:hypothetical protein
MSASGARKTTALSAAADFRGAGCGWTARCIAFGQPARIRASPPASFAAHMKNLSCCIACKMPHSAV